MRELLIKFPLQINEAMHMGKHIKLKGEVGNIIVSGMGGSAITGDLLRDYIGNKVPIHVDRCYDIPDWVNKNSLSFVISYSGNTEEAISSYLKLKKKVGNIVVITSGGRLMRLCEDDNVNLIEIPAGMPPRSAIAYMLIPILMVLQNNKIIGNQTRYIRQAMKGLEKFDDKLAHDLAMSVYKKFPIVYASENYKGLVLRWKTQFNENSKVLALSNVFSELDHNEIEGFSKAGNYKVILLKDKKDFLRIKKRMRITERIIGKKNVDEVLLKGKSKLEKILYGVHLGDWTSFYLAMLEGIDPLDIDKIDYLKEKL